MKRLRHFWRGLFFFVLIAALCGGLALPAVGAPVQAAPQMQVATDLVISEFRFRGSAGGNDEFVEIFNPTGAPVDLNGWMINGSNNGGTTGTRYTFTTSILLQPGQHYLITNTGYNDSVVADATYGTGITADGGVALLRPDSSIADQIGLSSGSAYLEGTVLSGFPSDVDQSYERQLDVSGNCTDANNNAADFFLRNPSDPQNSSSPITTCGNPTPAPSPTSSATNTGTPTNTSTATNTGTATSTAPTNTLTGARSIVINEVAWAGTAASTSDEWIELYNPGSSPVNLAGWVLKGADGTPNIALTGTLPNGGYFLLERTDNNTVIDAVANQIYTGELENSTEILQLYDPSNRLIDTANSNGGLWPAGSPTTPFNSMERRGVIVDSDTAWITNVQSSTWTKHDARCTNANPSTCSSTFLIRGTPGYGNWAYTVTPTRSPTPTPTRRPTATRTPSPLPPPPLVAINEFVPRPGHDWNNDGEVNVGDEYVEVINHGVIDVNLSGYSLDDEVNIGSSPYRLPSVTIEPGQRMVFYGSETGLLLSDGGDGVRLLKPNGQLADAYNYFVVKYPDQSFCRLPDNGGLDDWNQNCFPTPGLQNSLSGFSVNPPIDVGDAVLCPIADTLPNDFILAECPPFGNIWRPSFWDRTGWYGEKYLPESPGKWPVFVD